MMMMKSLGFVVSFLLVATSMVDASLLESKRAWVDSIVLQKNAHRNLQVTPENFVADVCQPLVEKLMADQPDISCNCGSLTLSCTLAPECVGGSQFGVQFAQTCGNATVETCFTFGFTETFGADDDGSIVSFTDEIEFDGGGAVEYEQAIFERNTNDGTCVVQFRYNESLYECNSCEPCADGGGYLINCTNIQESAISTNDGSSSCGSLLSVFNLCPSQGVFTPTSGLIEETFICFSGDTTVNVLHKNNNNNNEAAATQQQQQQVVTAVPMKDLKIGDLVQTTADGDAYEPVYAFGHHDADIKNAKLLGIRTNQSRVLEISPQHMMFLHNGSAVPASLIRKGDLIMTTTTTNNEPALVTSIIKSKTTHSGVFAPFTKSGTIVVNDNLVASTYVAFQENSEYFTVGGSYYKLPWTHQWLAHVFVSAMAPHNDDKANGGVAQWIQGPYDMAQWFVQQDSPLVQLALLLPAVAFAVASQYYWSLVMLVGVVVAAALMVRKKAKKQKTL